MAMPRDTSNPSSGSWNLNTGIAVGVVIVALLTLGSVVEVVLGWVPLTWAKKLVKDWDRLENLKLLEDVEKHWAENGHTGDDARGDS
ncbi:hypothetical protein BU25DRAFT_462394 [Macroventuria anomochaeta]|uniref:Uncharacterized protein n=1 Tax=Macroventuria anomochaeta TaxID=301207 RepID=A0ACB6RQ14_9PLEO|nr:uncharacterized protein BU25DRAFT_462394 [Macroventuria anomochaeta]KAF2623004.1 hypothetical protein BU25DRAFT_462394 [Macroventuria anomochaeta]